MYKWSKQVDLATTLRQQDHDGCKSVLLSEGTKLLLHAMHTATPISPEARVSVTCACRHRECEAVDAIRPCPTQEKHAQCRSGWNLTGAFLRCWIHGSTPPWDLGFEKTKKNPSLNLTTVGFWWCSTSFWIRKWTVSPKIGGLEVFLLLQGGIFMAFYWLVSRTGILRYPRHPKNTWVRILPFTPTLPKTNMDNYPKWWALEKVTPFWTWQFWVC